MRKKIVALVLGLSMMLGLLSGCGAKEKEESNISSESKKSTVESSKDTSSEVSSEVEEEKELVSLRLIMYGDMTPRREEYMKKEFHDAVLEELNIDLTVEFLPWSSKNVLETMLASGEEFAFNNNNSFHAGFVQKGFCAEIPEELIQENCQEYLAMRETNGFECAKFEGKIYTIPFGCKSNGGTSQFYTVRKDILDELGVKAEDVTTTEQLLDLFAKVKEKYPNMRVTMDTDVSHKLVGYALTGELITTGQQGVYVNDLEEGDKVYSWYESEAFEATAKFNAQLVKEGYSLGDSFTDPGKALADWNAGYCFSRSGAAGHVVETGFKSTMPDAEMTRIKIGDAPYTITSDYDWGMSISASDAENVDRWLELFNWMYQDQETFDFLVYGVEGKDYERNADGTINRLVTDVFWEDWFMMANCYQISHIDMVFAQHLQTAKDFMAELYESNDGKNVRLKENVNAADSMGFLLEMRKSLNNNPAIHSVYVINRLDEVILHATNSVEYTEELNEKLPERLRQESNRNVPFVWKVQNRYEGKEDVGLLCMYVREAPSDSRYYAGAIAVNLDLGWLTRIMFSSMEDNGMTEFFIIDQNGIVISHSKGSHYGENIADREVIRNILNGEFNTQQERIDNILYEINAVESQQNGFFIVSQSNYVDQMESTRNMFVLILMIIVVVSVGIVVISWLMSRKMFEPLRKMVEDIRYSSVSENLGEYSGNELQYLQSYHRNISQYIENLKRKEEKDYIVKNLLMGNLVQQLLLKKDMVYKSLGYCLIMIYMLESEEFGSLDEYNVRYNRMSEIISISLGKVGKCTWFEVGLRRRLFLLSEVPEMKRNGEDFVDSIRKTLYQTFEGLEGARFLIFAESAESSGQDLRELYKVMSNKLKTRLLLSPEAEVILGEALCCHGETLENGGSPDKTDQVGSLVSQVKQQLKDGDRETYLKCFNKLLEIMKNAPWDAFVECLEKLVFDIMKIHETVNVEGAKENTRQQIRDKIETMGDRQALMEWFALLYDKTNGGMQKVNTYSVNDMIEKAIDHIHNHYGDMNLNMNALARKMNVSASYFGKLFKDFAGCSTSEYLTKVRLERAHNLLLLEPEKDIIRIAAEVGYSNAGYFATVFKKYYGVSPSKLRDYYAVQEGGQEE